MNQEEAQVLPDCPDPATVPGAAQQVPGVRLPTLQRNALSKVFNRPEFTPQEVFALGYRRLQRTEGVGQKGLQSIIAWLALHGYQLSPPAEPASPAEKLPADVRRSISGAVRLLRHYGYRVRRAGDQRSN